ncbi:pollen-specific leucine-rich repeat extensin-like protein 1 [Lolium rigidum]|uniref:pollen-specific leucine-rich repeat extensin-like protein 1 n=1 Tax=Lolium rigidum TaxID=89674 RepID=UPI001F5D1277|nr:pollen-specific leucine-rich repeat extensin-like protein 1 [Lolium rigidum]
MSGTGAPAGRGSMGGSRSFDFGTDDVLCSYDDFAAPSDPKRPDPVDKDFHDSRYGRPSVKVYEQESYAKEDVLSAVERCMKKYADNLLRSLEGITSRLSQLEIYCYKLERSIGELRSDMLRGETDLRLKSLEKHLHEVHRSIQILRDKQELAETQKELAKFQLKQDESKKKEDVPMPSEPKKLEEKREQQLALALPHQVNSPSHAPRASEPVQQYHDQPVQQTAPSSLVPQQDRYVVSQAIAYYPQQQTPGNHDTQGQQVQPEVQYLPARPQAQDVQASSQPQSANQIQPQSYPPYQQQWQQQPSRSTPGPAAQPQQTYSQQPFPPPVQQPQLSNAQQFPAQPMQQSQLSNPQQFPPPQLQPQQSNPHLPQTVQPQHPQVQAQMRPQTPPNYSRYPPQQPLNPSPETLPGSASMQGPYSTAAPPGGSHSEAQYSYAGPGIPPSQPPPQHSMQRQQLPPPNQSSYGPPPSKGPYAGPPQYAPQGHSQGYNPAYGYPPSGPSAAQSPQMPPGGAGMSHPGSSQHMMRGHPYGEMIEKAITMGYPRDQVLNVIQRMTESGHQIDFNALLDRLNESGSGAPPRAW